MKVDVVAFDVNETLLDVSAMVGPFRQAVGPEVTVGEWFSSLLHRSLVANQLGAYRPFGELAGETLLWLAARESIDLGAEEAEDLVANMTHLPPHPDVRPGLDSLRGRRLVALTNSGREAATKQVTNAGLADHFQSVLSVDAVRRFKPDAEVYRYAARECEVDIRRMMLVAAHDWDVAGAQAAGAVGCFVRRRPWALGDAAPDLEIDDLRGLAAALEE